MAKTKEVVERENILNKFWEEVKKVNWKEINKLCMMNFSIGLVGTETSVEKMKTWLSTLIYEDQNIQKIKDSNFNQIITIICDEANLSRSMFDKIDFCIVDKEYVGKARCFANDIYIFDENDFSDFPKKILSNHSKIGFALAYSFPIFRNEKAKEQTNSTSFQNMTWAAGTALPNTVPGPHQPVTIPIEALSDFAVLSMNEVKLIFELIGISGRKVNPAFCIIEFGIIFSCASIAQTIATTVAGKVPLGVGVAIKGGIAYAFTMVIGEIAKFYLFTGKRAGKKAITDWFKKYKEIGIEKAKELVNNKNQPSA